MERKESEYFQEVKPFENKKKNIKHDYKLCPECSYELIVSKKGYKCLHCGLEIMENK